MLTPRLDDHLCFSLYAAHRAMNQAYALALDPVGLTYLQYLVLVALHEADDVPVKAVGERLRLDSGTLTPALQRMERAGFVAKARDAADERRVRVRLTDAGRAAFQQALVGLDRLLCASEADPAALIALREELWGLVRVLDGTVARVA